MRILRQTLSLLAVTGALLSAGCELEETTDSDVSNATEISESLMEARPERPGMFDTARRKGGQWYFNLVGDRGDLVLQSEDYVEQPSAINGILSVEENGVHLGQYQLVDLGNDEWSFVLRAKNNQVIADGQIFRSPEEAEAGIFAARELVAGVVQYQAAADNGARFDLWKDQDNKMWYFVLRAEDGRILLESEDYQARGGAVNGIVSVRENGKLEQRYKIIVGEDGVYVSLKAGNNHEIATSGPYASETDAASLINETRNLLDSERVANPW